MIQNDEKTYVRGYGKLPLIYAVRFVPRTSNGECTLVHAAGVESVSRTAEGVYDVVLSDNVADVLANGFPFAILDVHFSGVETTAGAADHNYVVDGIVESTGTITLVHQSVDDIAADTDPYASNDGETTIDSFMVTIYALEA